MSALVSGFERGFNMMERHKNNQHRRERADRLDAENAQRHAASQARLSDIDKKNEQRYQAQQARLTQLDKRNEQRDSNTQAYRQWQMNQQKNTQQWAKDRDLFGPAWQYFRENGQVAPEHDEMFKRNPGYDPRTFQSPEYRAKVKRLGDKVQEVMAADNMEIANSPDTINAFNEVFKPSFARSIGEVDKATGATITDVNVAGLVPTNNGLSFALKVDYDNGESQIKPMTQGRTSEPDDPVLTMQPKELVQTIKAKMMMADMIERPDYWDKMGMNVGQRMTAKQSSPKVDKHKATYLKELSDIEQDLTNALAKIETSLDSHEPERKAEAIAKVTSLYQARKASVSKAYGYDEPATNEQSTSKASQVKYTSTVPKHDAEQLIKMFMDRNKGLSKDAAIALAKAQGYITDDK